MAVAETSKAAYAAEKAAGKLQANQLVILKAMQPGHQYTVRELMALTKLEVNVVSGRCSELKALNLIEVVAYNPCAITGKSVQCLELTKLAAPYRMEQGRTYLKPPETPTGWQTAGQCALLSA